MSLNPVLICLDETLRSLEGFATVRLQRARTIFPACLNAWRIQALLYVDPFLTRTADLWTCFQPFQPGSTLPTLKTPSDGNTNPRKADVVLSKAPYRLWRTWLRAEYENLREGEPSKHPIIQ